MVDSSLRNVVGGQYGAHHDTIRAALKEVLANVELPEMNDGRSRKRVFKSFHFPEDKDDLRMAERLLKFDEALQLQLALAERRKGRGTVDAERISCAFEDDSKIESYFPYCFTKDQHQAICKVNHDLNSTTPMQRLIHGEVGSGKTAVAFYAAMLAALNGKRTLILCPTTILADQHYDTLKGMGWDDCQLWLGMGGSKGEVGSSITIGTHALLNCSDAILKSTSLVIIDEFQKFGVEQRAKITKHNPHLLLLSATPIPRTLAATVFGDLDISIIRELPIKRGQVITRWVLPEKREGMYEIIERELAVGHQAYVVHPRISGDEDVVSAEQGYVELRDRFGDQVVDILTGKDTTSEKASRLQRFKQGHTKILVSTIIAEVGLDNSNATMMVIEGADRFGLSQLHQLRGRVCRSTDTAFCFLVSETANQTSIDRLDVIEKCNDGFEISENDLRLRGPGEVFSTRQSGLPDLKWCSLVDDYDLMVEAKEVVTSGDVGDGVREMMRIRYGDNLYLGEVT
jgi:ATP-dependent DNA helicase RecG